MADSIQVVEIDWATVAPADPEPRIWWTASNLAQPDSYVWVMSPLQVLTNRFAGFGYLRPEDTASAILQNVDRLKAARGVYRVTAIG